MRTLQAYSYLVPKAGLEPARGLPHSILSRVLLCLHVSTAITNATAISVFSANL